MRMFLFALVVAGIVAFAARSHGEVTGDVSPTLEAPPPTAKTPLYAGSGGGQHHEPFTSYDPGPGTWSYSDLGADEKAQADHAKSATNWGSINAGYAGAIKAQADAATASSADHQLGLDSSATIGVVP